MSVLAPRVCGCRCVCKTGMRSHQLHPHPPIAFREREVLWKQPEALWSLGWRVGGWPCWRGSCDWPFLQAVLGRAGAAFSR